MADAAPITVFLADDSVLMREGVRSLLAAEPDLAIVGTASDYDELVSGVSATEPQVVVTDIRMPPNFQMEGIAAAKEIRKRNPGTGIVVLSQYDEPEYAITLFAEGAAGYAYLLKDRMSDDGRLGRAIREVATGGSMVDPEIVDALVHPMGRAGALTRADEHLLRQIAEGRPVKAIASASGTTPHAVNEAIEDLFLHLARAATAGQKSALRQLRLLHKAIVDREEQGETLSRLLPSGLADRLRTDRDGIARPQRLEVTVLMSDVRGYTSIAERTDLTCLAGQLNEHRQAMNAAILDEGGTVMQYIGDAVMAVFGAPLPQDDHAGRALRAARAMHLLQADLNERWGRSGLAPFGLGIGISTGEVAAALLGSAERLEYTVVGDTVNLAQRLQDLARPAGTTVILDATMARLSDPPQAERLAPQFVKGREAPVLAHRLDHADPRLAGTR